MKFHRQNRKVATPVKESRDKKKESDKKRLDMVVFSLSQSSRAFELKRVPRSAVTMNE